MNTINIICTTFGDILLWPFMVLGLSTGLVLFSMCAGLLIILVLPSISNQTGIKWAKDKIKGHLLEVYLYRNNVGIAMKAQLNMLRYNMAYVFFALTPVVVLMIPFVLIMIQLNARFGYDPLRVGDSANVKALFNETLPEEEITLTSSEGIKIETPSCRVPQNGEVIWRIRALKEGRHSVTLQVGDSEITKEIVVGMDRAITPIRYRSALSQSFLPRRTYFFPTKTGQVDRVRLSSSNSFGAGYSHKLACAVSCRDYSLLFSDQRLVSRRDLKGITE